MSIFDNGENKKRVAIYIRVSTTEQNSDGYSLVAQKKRLTNYVNNSELLNLTTKDTWIFEDTHTGSDLNRPALNNLRNGVKNGKFDAVLIWKIDRLSRSLKHLLNLFEEFEKNNVSLISIQENINFRGPIGKLIFQIFGAIAQFERELIKGRTTMGKIASAELGNYTGSSIPYGYIGVKNKSGRGKKLELLKDEQEWVQQIYTWYIYDDMGFGEIASKLNDLKVKKGRGGNSKKTDNKWTAKSIGNIIKNDVYEESLLLTKMMSMVTNYQLKNGP